jgi:hypothetical protein
MSYVVDDNQLFWNTVSLTNGWSENCTLLDYYAASSGNFLLKFQEKPIGPIFRVQKSREKFLTPEDGTDRLSQNVGRKLPLSAA